MQLTDTRTGLDARLADIDALLDAWLDEGTLRRTVDAAVDEWGDARADVEAQLRLVAARCRSHHLRELIDGELGSSQALGAVPERMLVLASAAVPGLAVEAMLTAVALGIHVTVRAARRERVLGEVVALMPLAAPMIGELVELVGPDAAIDWLGFDGCVVYGSDETIAHVRTLLPPAATVAAYGSRSAIALVEPGALAAGTVAERLADDVLMFGQRGCMSPRTIFVLGDASDAEQVAEHLQRELTSGWPRHRDERADAVDQLAARAAEDAARVGAVGAAGARVAGVGDVWVIIEPLAGGDVAASARISLMGSQLQTAVIVSSDERRGALAQLCLDAGCTRIALPGGAHEPHALWPHDGIGRMAPLLGFRAG